MKIHTTVHAALLLNLTLKYVSESGSSTLDP